MVGTRVASRFLWIILLTAGTLVFGCKPPAVIQKEIQTSIEQSPDWKLKEQCGDDDCTTMVNILINKNMSVRIALEDDKRTGLFFNVRTDFVSLKYQAQYTPAAVSVALNSGELLKPKVFTCFYTISDLEYLRSRPSLEGTFSLSRQDCYLLFFDHAALKPGEEAVMNMNNALTLHGKRMDVPLVRFKRTVISTP